jgi:hypothetical protein
MDDVLNYYFKNSEESRKISLYALWIIYTIIEILIFKHLAVIVPDNTIEYRMEVITGFNSPFTSGLNFRTFTHLASNKSTSTRKSLRDDKYVINLELITKDNGRLIVEARIILQLNNPTVADKFEENVIVEKFRKAVDNFLRTLFIEYPMMEIMKSGPNWISEKFEEGCGNKGADSDAHMSNIEKETGYSVNLNIQNLTFPESMKGFIEAQFFNEEVILRFNEIKATNPQMDDLTALNQARDWYGLKPLQGVQTIRISGDGKQIIPVLNSQP